MKTIIRRYRADDARAVHALDLTFPDAQSWFAVKHPLRNERRFVATMGGRIIGYIFMREEKRDEFLPGNTGHDAAYITDFGVSRDYQGQGIGIRLMDRAMSWRRLRHLTPALLHVNCDNAQAIRFYRRYGFARVATVTEYYDDAAGWLMSKK